MPFWLRFGHQNRPNSHLKFDHFLIVFIPLGDRVGAILAPFWIPKSVKMGQSSVQDGFPNDFFRNLSVSKTIFSQGFFRNLDSEGYGSQKLFCSNDFLEIYP